MLGVVEDVILILQTHVKHVDNDVELVPGWAGGILENLLI